MRITRCFYLCGFRKSSQVSEASSNKATTSNKQTAVSDHKQINSSHAGVSTDRNTASPNIKKTVKKRREELSKLINNNCEKIIRTNQSNQDASFFDLSFETIAFDHLQEQLREINGYNLYKRGSEIIKIISNYDHHTLDFLIEHISKNYKLGAIKEQED